MCAIPQLVSAPLFKTKRLVSMVESRFTDTCFKIRTPHYMESFFLSLEKAFTFSLNSTSLIRTPVYADNGHLSLTQTLYLRATSYSVELLPRVTLAK